MIKYIITVAVVGVLAYGTWFLYHDDTTEEVRPLVTSQEE
tara:strand:- start:4 stop:123 length:120 start_codon:yes stop_codon:yes gene_type:complete